MDKISPARRSANMRAIRSRDTKPEITVRRLAHAMGYRFRLHRKDLPGKPGLVFPRRHAVIFIRGCFWHQHSGPACLDARPPKSNTSYWHAKLARNLMRDAGHETALQAQGWRVHVIWDCETKNTAAIKRRLQKILSP
jgi:DNA mismatch endonuclease (patch repair protein)